MLKSVPLFRSPHLAHSVPDRNRWYFWTFPQAEVEVTEFHRTGSDMLLWVFEIVYPGVEMLRQSVRNDITEEELQSANKNTSPKPYLCGFFRKTYCWSIKAYSIPDFGGKPEYAEQWFLSSTKWGLPFCYPIAYSISINQTQSATLTVTVFQDKTLWYSECSSIIYKCVNRAVS